MCGPPGGRGGVGWWCSGYLQGCGHDSSQLSVAKETMELLQENLKFNNSQKLKTANLKLLLFDFKKLVSSSSSVDVGSFCEVGGIGMPVPRET